MMERIESLPEMTLVAEDKETGRLAGMINAVTTSEDHFRDAFLTDTSTHDSLEPM